MKTSLIWDESVKDRKLPILPEGMGDFECGRLIKGDKLEFWVEDYSDEAEVIVTDVKITFYMIPIEDHPFAEECDCIQWVTIKPDWDKSED